MQASHLYLDAPGRTHGYLFFMCLSYSDRKAKTRSHFRHMKGAVSVSASPSCCAEVVAIVSLSTAAKEFLMFLRGDLRAWAQSRLKQPVCTFLPKSAELWTYLRGSAPAEHLFADLCWNGPQERSVWMVLDPKSAPLTKPPQSTYRGLVQLGI